MNINICNKLYLNWCRKHKHDEIFQTKSWNYAAHFLGRMFVQFHGNHKIHHCNHTRSTKCQRNQESVTPFSNFFPNMKNILIYSLIIFYKY